jgi:hypothetical protein
MGNKSRNTKPPGRPARRRKATAKRRLTSTPRLKGVKKGLSAAEQFQHFSVWLTNLEARLKAACRSLETLEADKVQERLALLDEIRDDLDADLRVGGLPSTDANQRRVDKFQEDWKAVHGVAWRRLERCDLSRLAEQLERRAFLGWVKARQLKEALERPDEHPDVLRAGMDHIQDTRAAMVYLEGRMKVDSRDWTYCRAALVRVLESDVPLDRQLRETMSAMAAATEKPEGPWAARQRQLIPRNRSKPKTAEGKKSGPRPDPFKRMNMVEFVRRRHVEQGESITSAVEAASAKFGKSVRHIFDLWAIDQKFQAIIRSGAGAVQAPSADKDQ